MFFQCHKGGDIFKFVEEIEGVEFIEALKLLAEKAGVSLDKVPGEKPSKHAVLRDIMETATKFYEVAFRKNKAVVDYLLSRGMTKDTMVAFRVGYTEKGWSNLYDFLKKKYADADILATGLCIQGQKGLYDRFRERIMFPISDGQGRVIAFTGRVLPGTEEASRPVGKYINSPETDLYHKSSVLFAYDKAKAHIHTDGFVIIVEGQMDCIMSHQAGVKNVVALSGTASTDLHMGQLERFTTNIAICLDADKAGLAAAQKTAMVAYKHGMNVLVIDTASAAQGQVKDPADLIAEDPELWKKAISHRKDFITFRLEKMKEQGEVERKVSIAEQELFPVMAHIQSHIILDDKIQEIAHAFGSSTSDPVRREFEKFMQKNPVERAAAVAPEKQQNDPKKVIAESIIGILRVMKDQPEHDALIIQLEELSELRQDAGDQAEQWAFKIEQQIGRPPEAVPVLERTFRDLLLRYRLIMIDEEKSQLDKQLVASPHDADVLKKIHELLRRKDALIHQSTNH
jgi:DNA primase catalytic core